MHDSRTYMPKPVDEIDVPDSVQAVLDEIAGLVARPEIELALRRCSEIIEPTGARLYAPQAHEQCPALAGLGGDAAARERHLREAHRLYTEMGAAGHAEQVARDPGL